MPQLHVYVKIRIDYSDDGYGCRLEGRPEVWGLVLAPPEGARQASPCLWLAEEDGRMFQYHGPVVVPAL